MDLGKLPIFSLLREKMGYLTDRQTAISANLANADTPGYQAKRLKEPDFARFLDDAGEGGLVRTDARHMGGGPRLGGIGAREAEIHGQQQTSPDGNSVDVSEQVMEMADTQLQYNMATNIYRKQVRLLRTALGRQGG